MIKAPVETFFPLIGNTEPVVTGHNDAFQVKYGTIGPSRRDR